LRGNGRPNRADGEMKHFINHRGTGVKQAGNRGNAVTIWSESTIMCSRSRGQLPQGHQGTQEMPRSKKDVRVKQPTLASQYRAIGPAAIAAALLHTPKKQKPVQKFITPRAA
jgi:hypothetical protein